METCVLLATTVTMAPTPLLPVPRGHSSTPRAWETSTTACSVLQDTTAMHMDRQPLQPSALLVTIAPWEQTHLLQQMAAQGTFAQKAITVSKGPANQSRVEMEHT